LLSSTLGTALAAEPVRIGVLAFRPKPQTLAQWQPLASALKKALPERDFEVQALTYPELNQSVAQRQLDFVLTNPGHYVLLSKRHSLSSPLATLSINEAGTPTSVFGGVVFTRAGAIPIPSLADLKGKTIAATNTESLGGYQMQAFELLQAGVRLPTDAKLHLTGVPHDKVVEAVMSGQADAGFVRTGVLEALAREAKLDMNQIRVLNRQTLPGSPVQVSTRLYPEWPFAALAGVEESLARHVAAALFLLDTNTATTRAMQIHGFVIPEDYMPVADMLRKLRMPPFDEVPEITLGDIWQQHRWTALLLLVAMSLILLLALRLLLVNRKLAAEQRIVLEQQNKLQESENRWNFALEGSGDGVWDWDIPTGKVFFSRRWKEMLGFAAHEIGDELSEWESRVNSADKEETLRTVQACLDGKIPAYASEHRMRCKDGSWKWILDRGMVISRDQDGKPLRMIGTHSDVTRRHQEQLKLGQLLIEQKALLDNQLIGIATVRNREIHWANPAFAQILGYTPEELQGMATRRFYPDQQSYEAFGETAYTALKRGESFRMQRQLVRKSGRTIWVDMNGVLIHPETGESMWGFLDITDLKNAEEQIRNLAFYDPLTRLPNRRMLHDRLGQALAVSKRSGCHAALMVLDLDNFKPLNDTHGHVVGDLLLVDVAQRLKSCVREMDTVARFGGDEFVVMLPELDENHDQAVASASLVAEKIRQILAQPYQLTLCHEGQDDLTVEHRCSASIGVVLFKNHQSSQDDLFEWADAAMYQAKDAGRNRVQMYQPS
jgi:diguanylate cyclase (GGDEF)-like protein/PAS domain S-box-containing protein